MRFRHWEIAFFFPFNMPKVNLVILTTNCLPGLHLGTDNYEINRKERTALPWKETAEARTPSLPPGGMAAPSSQHSQSTSMPFPAPCKVPGLSELGLFTYPVYPPHLPVQDAAGCSGEPCLPQLSPPYHVLVTWRET